MDQIAKEIGGILGDANTLWLNYWVSIICATVLGFMLGYLWREKKLWDHKKGKHGRV